MYRISAYVVRNSPVLLKIRRTTPAPVITQSASLSRAPTPPLWDKNRASCDPPPPPPLKPYKFNFYLITSGLLLALTGGFIVYAKSNPEVRDWLSINAPWFDDIIAALYEENKPLDKSLAEFIDYFKSAIDRHFREIPEECYGTPTPMNVAQRAPLPKAEPSTVDDSCEDEDDDDDDEDEDEDDEEAICIPQDPPIRTADVCKFEECLKETAEEVVCNFETIKSACCVYDKSVNDAMTRKFSIQELKDLKNQQEERDAFIKEFTLKNEDAMQRFNNLMSRMKCGIEAPEDRIEAIRQKGKEYSDIIKRSKAEFLMAWEQSLHRDKQWKMSECLMDGYTLEIEALYPELKLASDRPTIHGDLDFLLIHTKKYMDNLRAKLDDERLRLKSKINGAYNSIEVPPGKENELKCRLEEAYKKAKEDLAREFANREAQWKKDSDDALKEKLGIQKRVMDEQLEKMIAKKCQDMTECSDKLVSEKVAEEKKKLDCEREKMEKQFRLLEAKLEEHIKAEVETRRAAQLYAASASMLNATFKGDPRIKIDKELEILKKNSAGDPLVATVLNAIPQEVTEKGLVPEIVIKNKFPDMEDVAMKVAMVERQGGPLPMYAFSWLQSRFLFMKPNNIPQVELDNPPEEPFQNFDTFDLLQRARYFMSRGNLASAVRYVDALEGASRGAAEHWYQNANALLQTRQAAQAILAHAAAIRLKYL